MRHVCTGYEAGRPGDHFSGVASIPTTAPSLREHEQTGALIFGPRAVAPILPRITVFKMEEGVWRGESRPSGCSRRLDYRREGLGGGGRGGWGGGGGRMCSLALCLPTRLTLFTSPLHPQMSANLPGPAPATPEEDALYNSDDFRMYCYKVKR